MANENNNQALDPQKAAEVQFINYKNQITNSVMKRVETLEAAGGVTVPKNYSVGNQINLAMLRLTTMKDKDGNLILTKCTSASVANSLLNMCIQGLSLEKGQCYFVPYGNELQFQRSYLGNVALAKRVGGAGDPQAQVIYADDVFEYVINPETGKKKILKHEQKLENIDNSKIVGAWCLIPFADHPDWDPRVEIMTMAEIRTAWMQGQTKGESKAHRNFTQEMAKKTIISRACKMFFATSDDAGIFGEDDVDDQTPEMETRANATEAVFEALPQAPSVAAVESVGNTVEAAVEPVKSPESVKVGEEAPEESVFGQDFFNA